MNSDRLEAYLTARLGEPVRVASLTQAFPGLSRETWLVTLRGSDGETSNRGFVIRVDAPGGPFVPVPLSYEWQVYERLARTDVPVPKPLWFDASPEVSDGRSLFVRELVDGSTLLPGLHDPTPEAARRRQRVAFEHAEKLAQVHRVDWQRFGFDEFMDAPGSPENAPRHELMRWWRVWEHVRTNSFPVVTEALYWFHDHLPRSAPRVCLCKGQNGIGEEIWRDDRIVALCDWELSHLGDPCHDLALSQGMLKLWNRDEVIAHYEQAAGFELPAENVAFFIVWNAFKSLLALNNGLSSFLNGQNTRLPRATLGFGKVKIYEHLLGSILDMDLAEAAEFILSGQPNPYHSRQVAGG
jgi:aminoglycoside phosphotransferase (APT) family kinase protein